MLYSADAPFVELLSSTLDANKDADRQTTHLLTDLEFPPELPDNFTQVRSVYVVDTAIEDHQLLIDSFALHSTDHLVLIDQSSDGFRQLADALSGLESIGELHIFSHAIAGEIHLGSERLNLDNFDKRSDSIAAWASSLTDDADILFYGCNLADSETGKHLLTKIAQLSSADIAASNDLTGNPDSGGDLDLEFRIGQVEASLRSGLSGFDHWQGLLGAIEVTTTDDLLDGNTDSIADLYNNPGQDGLISLREAVAAANNTLGHDQILLAAETYALSDAPDDLLQGDYDITDTLTISGESTASTVIDGRGLHRLFEVHNGDLTLMNLSLINGSQYADHGGALVIHSGHTIALDVEFSWNSIEHGYGGAIYHTGDSALTLKNSVFNSNTSHLNNAGPETVLAIGGAIFSDASNTLEIVDSTFLQNYAESRGGAIAAASELVAHNVTFERNQAGEFGGAIHLDASANATIQESEFSVNKSESGGAIHSQGELFISTTSFYNNGSMDNSVNNGGAIYSVGNALIASSTFYANAAIQGGAIATAGTADVDIENSTFSENSARFGGGAIYAFRGSVDLSYSTFYQNTGGDGSGALASSGLLIDVNNSLFSGNTGGGARNNAVMNNAYSSGFNAYDVNPAVSVHTSDLVNALTNIDVLRDNGGSVETHALLAGSEAIDSGWAEVRMDATGQGSDVYSDIGAYEYRGTGETLKIFWTDGTSSQIFRANSSGGSNPLISAVQQIAASPIIAWHIEVDTAGQRLIWSENNLQAYGRIMQAGLDGRNLSVMTDVSTHPFLFGPRGVAIDEDNSHLYAVIDNGSAIANDTVYRFDLGETSLTNATLMYSGNFATQYTTGLPDISFAKDLELIELESNGERWIAWSDISESLGLVQNYSAVTFLNLDDVSDVYQVEFIPPAYPENLTPEGLVWDSANQRLHLATNYGGSYLSHSDVSGRFEMVNPLTFSNLTNSFGMEYDQSSDLVYTTRGSIQSQFFGVDSDHTSFALIKNYPGVAYSLALHPVASAPLAPEVITNNGVSGNTTDVTITSSDLSVADPDSTADSIRYVIDRVPLYGSLSNSETLQALGLADSFTQQDIDSGKISYLADPGGNTVDSFEFSVTDGHSVIDKQLFHLESLEVFNYLPMAEDASMSLLETEVASTLLDQQGNTISNLADISRDLNADDTLSYGLYRAPIHGTAIVNNDGSFTYDFDESLELETDTFSYYVSDGVSGSAIGQISVSIGLINDHPPQAVADAVTVIEGGSTSVLSSGASSILANDTDPDLPIDLLQVSIVDPESTAMYGDLSLSPDGTFTYVHDGSENHSDSFNYLLTDAVGHTSVATVSINVVPVNDNSPLVTNDSITVREGDAVSSFDSGRVNLLEGLTDVDASDTAFVQPVLITEPVVGGLTINTDYTFVYHHDGTETLTDEFVYRVEDAAGNTTDVAINIIVEETNDNAPVVPDDELSVLEGASVGEFDSGRGNLLDNYTDIDTTDSVSIEPLLVLEPDFGELTIAGDGSFSYQHDGSESEVDNFIYRIKDAGGNTTDVSVIVAITGVNDNNPYVPDDSLTVKEGESTSEFDSGRLNLLAGLSDEDTEDSATVLPILVASPLSGEVTISPEGTFEYQHNGSESTVDSFIYRIQDTGGNTTDVNVSVNILPVSDAPVSLDSRLAVFEDKPYIFNLADFPFEDSDLDRLQSVIIEQAPISGSLFYGDTLVGSRQSVSSDDIVNGLLSYQSPTNEYGEALDSFKFRVTDDGDTGTGGRDESIDSYSMLIDVVKVNDPPQGENSTLTIQEDSYHQFSIADFPFSDPLENHLLGATLVTSVSGSGEWRFGGEELHSNTVISADDLQNGLLTYTPSQDLHGSKIARISYQLQDNGGTDNNGIDSNGEVYHLDIDVLPENDAPRYVSDISTLTVKEGESLQLDDLRTLFDDADGEVLALSLVAEAGSTLPGWVSFDAVKGSLLLTPGHLDAGSYFIVLSAEDAAAMTSSKELEVTVENVNRTPTGLETTEFYIDENQSGAALGQVIVLDPDSDDVHSIGVDDPRFSVVDGVLVLTDGLSLDHEQETDIAFNLDVVDKAGASIQVPVTISVNDLNDAPKPTLDLEPVSGTFPYLYEVKEDLFVDEDDDLIVYSASLADGSALPSWIVFDPDSRIVTFSDTAQAESSVAVMLVAEDGHGGRSTTVLEFSFDPSLAAALPGTPELSPMNALQIVQEPEALPAATTVSPGTDPMTVTDSSLSISQIANAATSSSVLTSTSASTLDSQSLLSGTTSANQNGFLPSTDFTSDRLSDLQAQSDSALMQSANEISIAGIQDILDQLKALDRETTTVTADSFYKISGNYSQVMQSQTNARASNYDLVDLPLSELMKAKADFTDHIDGSLLSELDKHREQLKDNNISVERVIATTTTVGASISVGYILWLMRSGVILSSLLSAMPAWRSIDPLPILDSLDKQCDDDEESLASLVKNGNREKIIKVNRLKRMLRA